jgi:hypothetical protein
MADEIVRVLVDARDRTFQKERIAFSNRLSAIERGADAASEEVTALVQKWLDKFNELEEELDGDIAKLIKDKPIVKEVMRLKGIGPMLSAKLISMIDIEKADTVSALWRYSGYGVINGERERPVAGEKLHYNKRLKTALYLVATSFMRSNSPYRTIYDSAKAYYQANRADWTPMHVHRAATRKMIKVFLAHLYERWRAIEGLEVRRLYVHEKLGHESEFRSADFGWSA